MSKKMAAFAESSGNTSIDSELSVGLELSIDENGIMWDDDQADTTYASEDLDSFRLSPSGSETAGDVDSSLLLSGSGSQPAPAKGGEGHRQMLEEIAETDEESSYQGLPAAPSKGQNGVRIGKGHIGGRGTTSSELRRDKGGMVSDIMSVRDKMMKYLEEDKGTKPKFPDSARSKIQEKQPDRKTAPSRTNELNNSQGKPSLPVYEKDRALAENGNNKIHNELNSDANFKSRYAFDSSDDLSSNSWSPVKPSTSKFERADSIDTDHDVIIMAQESSKEDSNKATARKVPKHKVIVRDENEVVEEMILPRSRSRPKISLDGMSRRLDLLSSSSESLNLSPRRKPFVKRREIKELTNQDKQVTPVPQDQLICEQPNTEHIYEERHCDNPKDVPAEDQYLQSSFADSGVCPDTKPSRLLNDVQVPPQSDAIDSSDAIKPDEVQSDALDSPDAINHDVVQVRPQSDAMDTPDAVNVDIAADDTKGNLGRKGQSVASSLSFDSRDDLAKYDNVPLKQAQPLRATFADDVTTDDELSRDDILDKPGGSAPPYREESTDFDFESDLERFSTPFKLTKGHKISKKNKVLTHKKAQPRGGSASRKSVPKFHVDGETFYKHRISSFASVPLLGHSSGGISEQ